MVNKNIIFYKTFHLGANANVEHLLRGINKTTYLNIMVCGASGVGKSSFIEVFLKKFNLKKAIDLIE
jgi:septin family protein